VIRRGFLVIFSKWENKEKPTGKELPIVITLINLGNGKLKYCKVLFFLLLIGNGEYWGIINYEKVLICSICH